MTPSVSLTIATSLLGAIFGLAGGIGAAVWMAGSFIFFLITFWHIDNWYDYWYAAAGAIVSAYLGCGIGGALKEIDVSALTKLCCALGWAAFSLFLSYAAASWAGTHIGCWFDSTQPACVPTIHFPEYHSP